MYLKFFVGHQLNLWHLGSGSYHAGVGSWRGSILGGASVLKISLVSLETIVKSCEIFESHGNKNEHSPMWMNRIRIPTVRTWIFFQLQAVLPDNQDESAQSLAESCLELSWGGTLSWQPLWDFYMSNAISNYDAIISCQCVKSDLFHQSVKLVISDILDNFAEKKNLWFCHCHSSWVFHCHSRRMKPCVKLVGGCMSLLFANLLFLFHPEIPSVLLS